MVECTNGWINHCRRIDRHYETTLAAHGGFLYLSLYLSQIALLLRRLDRSQLFDTLLKRPGLAGDSVQGSPINSRYVVPTDAGSGERSAE